MKHVLFSLLLSIPFFLLMSCNGSSPEDVNLNSETSDEEVVEKDPVELSWAGLELDTLADGTKFIMEGFIGDIGTYVDMTGGKMTIPIYERRNQKAGFKLNLSMHIGSTPNCVQSLPEEFTPEDFKVVCEDSSVVTTGAKVRITAIKMETYSPGYISANGMTLELLDNSVDASLFETAVPLTEGMIKDTSLKNVYCYVDGKLEIPSIVFSYTSDIMLDLKNSSVKDLTYMDVRVGEGASCMNDLPDNYTTKDLVLRDYKGDEIKYGTALRFYGTWERYSFETSTPGKFYLEEITKK